MSDPTTEVRDDEDLMAAELAALRSSRDAPAEAAVSEAAVAEQPAEPAAAPATTDQQASAATPSKEPEAAAVPAAAPKPDEDAALKAQRLEEQRIRSEEGRVRAYQQQIGERDRQIAELRQQLTSTQKPPETKAEALQRLESMSDNLKDFPELVTLIKNVGAALKENAEHAKTTAKAAAAQAVEPFEAVRRQHETQTQREAQAAAEAARAQYEGAYDEAVVTSTVRSPEFAAWLPKQHKAVQEAFHRGQSHLDAMVVLDAYDAHLKRAGQAGIARAPQPQQPAASAAAPSSPPAPAAPANDERLRRATGIPSRSGGRLAAMPAQDDFDGSFAFWRERSQAEKQRAAA